MSKCGPQLLGFVVQDPQSIIIFKWGRAFAGDASFLRLHLSTEVQIKSTQSATALLSHRQIQIHALLHTPCHCWLILQTMTVEKRPAWSQYQQPGIVIQTCRTNACCSNISGFVLKQTTPWQAHSSSKLVLDHQRQGDTEIFPQGSGLYITLA